MAAPCRRLTQVVRTACWAGILVPAACAPKIQHFTVAPQRACAGDSVDVVWRAGSDARLTATPPLAEAPAPAPAGSLRVAVRDTTQFVLQIVGTHTHREQDVAVYQPGGEKIFGVATHRLNDSTLTGAFTSGRGQWDSLTAVGEARSLSGRLLHVEHAGRSATLAADSSWSSAFGGARAAGRWEVTAPLVGEEVMGDTLHPPPSMLRFSAKLICAR